MIKLLGLLSVLVLAGSCKTPGQSSTTAERASVETRPRLQHSRTNIMEQPERATETELVPLLGRSEFGVKGELEGTWVLQTIGGNAVAEKSNVNVSQLKKKDSLGTGSTTEIVNGQTITTEIVYEKTSANEKKITPPQGSNYHIPAKPSISFFGSNETFTGFTGCNKISGRYRLSGSNNISFQKPAPSTRMVCIGDYDEVSFINALQQVNAYKSANGQLQLLSGNKVLLQFARQ